jgi:hypothetical protein
MKKLFAVIMIAVVHFGLTRIVMAVVLHMSAATALDVHKPLLEQVLIGLSKVLYFPLISMALYPRALFPGNFILVPIFINSLLWSICLYSIWVVAKRRI